MSAKCCILAVDDNLQNLEIVKESLSGLYDVQLVADAREALRMAPMIHPDIILLDVVMPHMDGLTLCAKFKHDPRLHSPRIIMFSAKSEAEDRRNGYHYGADDYLTKPFTEDELIAKIEYARQAHRSIKHEGFEESCETLTDSLSEVLTIMTSFGGGEQADHLLRIGMICRVLAKGLQNCNSDAGVDELFIKDLSKASVLHDIGKIAVAANLHHDASQLSAEEMSLAKQHTLSGEYFLSQFEGKTPAQTSFFPMAARVARWHHENWNGTGYPDGLQGKEIPLEARMVSLAHAIDDEISRYSKYESEIDSSDLFEAIELRSGKDFDPELVRVSFEILDEVIDFCKWLRPQANTIAI